MKNNRVLQCLARCPICNQEQVQPWPDRRCLGGRGHKTLHQCQKHTWGTLEQRAIELEQVSHDKTGRYTSWFQRAEQIKYLKESRDRQLARVMSGVDDWNDI